MCWEYVWEGLTQDQHVQNRQCIAWLQSPVLWSTQLSSTTALCFQTLSSALSCNLEVRFAPKHLTN